MTQESEAETMGVSSPAVSKWESGTSNPSTINLVAFVRVFHRAGIPHSITFFLRNQSRNGIILCIGKN